jgi:hypothetical protein
MKAQPQQYAIYRCKITSAVPLLMHNGLLADPLYEFTKMMKAISGKRDKTEADYLELSRLEWYGSLYIQDGSPCLPAEMIEAMVLEASKKKKKGVQAKAGIIVPDHVLLDYPGPRDVNAMWESGDFIHKIGVRVQRNKVIRTRPIFREWSATLASHYLPSLLNKSDVSAFMEIAGQVVGLGDWRPKFGRFTVEEV